MFGSINFLCSPFKLIWIYTFVPMAKLHKVYLLTGGNLGNRIATLDSASKLIEQCIGYISKSSSFYETAAWGNVHQPPYINQALEVNTTLKPLDVLHKIWTIEEQLGRVRRNKWEARIIDVDILFYDHLIIDKAELKVPHPLLHKRNFALIPMLEIAPHKRHPVFRKTIEELYLESEDTLDVVLLDSTALMA